MRGNAQSYRSAGASHLPFVFYLRLHGLCPSLQTIRISGHINFTFDSGGDQWRARFMHRVQVGQQIRRIHRSRRLPCPFRSIVIFVRCALPRLVQQR
jgi:hypothetical protein